MTGASLPVVFGAILAGSVMIDYGVKSAKAGFAAVQSVTAPSSSPSSSTTSTGTPTVTAHGFPASVNPIPGATPSRLDQGLDATGTRFLSPWDGTVVYSQASDPGWQGGGYVAIKSSAMPSLVYYLAEGITPTVQVGQQVKAGQQIATPRSNPYNGITGNVEVGLANPASPGQPLAQVTSNPAAMVTAFYNWLRSLGVGQATSTSQAGYP